MTKIYRGTTPTITYTFSTVDVADIAVAILTVSVNDVVVLEKDLTTATVGVNTLSWLFSQEDTLALTGRRADFMLNWLLMDGTRGVAENETAVILKNSKEEVINAG